MHEQEPQRLSTAVELEREEWLIYKLSMVQAREARLRVSMYERELNHAQAEAAKLDHELAKNLKVLSDKYGVDMAMSAITEDGYLIPRSSTPIPMPMPIAVGKE